MSLLSLFQKKLGVRPIGAPADSAEIPVLDLEDGPVYAVGDTHGSLSLYKELENSILRDAAKFSGVATIVLLGDMIDRGPQTAALIDHLLRPAPAPLRRVCLRGNHEAMMLAYLNTPTANANWLDFGGAETLASYGISMDPDALRRSPERKLRQLLAAHIPDSHLSFLRRTLPGLHVGTYLLAHAGADARAPLTAQPWQALLWGSEGLIAPNDLTLVHGHVITPDPEIGARSIGIDTGAYATGRLTSLRLIAGQSPAVLTLKDGSEFKKLSQ
ncbi:metallophosphoesterase [Roseinatronobacter sp. S2]|uniref:metallophosphoesterase n=1 Tax=Roseinatronobacter sp. S2 TaxID=3035471 RepID=UPI00240EA70A|nr:metallophosphoesterase [Roseinatronobacter sp. S2]WFE76939.1 metallophosphoesterase [Roseinatronobacter sp. S2]